ncbi:AfsR/SARP family transcriptional regulator [Mangrovihabitans endophyticus]|uniref:OmpR/PhoB-type domain-containing protein n=1 Tax=Mangrovihabitans endophyticus TaxID=1751298 RepID=A0A8J3BVR9_9ACTN|nr:BTAD domain-containing putative transcriptional regulator [Mangrovihabitans endophyticus]GGK81825.1 hypothetical protein GCM10012284_14860 [Mangrovihabitans endophyticus]
MLQRSLGDVASARLSFSILGPVQVLGDGRPVPLRSLKSRAVLALLILHRGWPVGPALLVDRVWDGPPPPTAPASVRNLLSALRRLLATDDQVSITTGEEGYVFQAPAEAVDLETFETRRARGRGLMLGGAWDAAARELGRALDHWTGPALMDLALAGIDWPERTALDERRLATIEDLVQVDLTRQRYREVLVRLTRLLAEHPGREALHRARIIALQRSGRRAEAARAYLDARKTLAEHTGREPSAEFRDLHRRILADEHRTVDSQFPPPVDTSRASVVTRSVRRSDAAGRSLIPRVGAPDYSSELAHEVRAVAVLCVRVCAPALPAATSDHVGDIVAQHGGVMGEIRGSTMVSYFGLADAEPGGEAGTTAADRAAACAIALHASGSVDRIRSGDLNGTVFGAVPPSGDGGGLPPTRFACVIATGPVMHVVRKLGRGEVVSWVAGEMIELCQQRAGRVRPGETAIF